jgi:flap endonuclease-1
MGIQGLTKLISENAPGAIKKLDIKNYFGRKVAIDASTTIYQFLISIRGQDGANLQTEDGQTTSHILGMFYRTIRMVDHGIKPVYVFDGKPPQMKSGELAKRSAKRDEAQKSLEEAKETGDAEEEAKFTRRLVKATPEHSQECKKLLELMGIPFIQAPCEAEAQCAALCKAGKVFAAVSEDMDTLTFSSPVLLRNLTQPESKKLPVSEFNLEKVLEDLGITMESFIDLCILMGCDYCDSIRGIGPHRALNLIKQHGNIETILENLDKEKYPLPPNFNYVGARELFLTPDVEDAGQVDFKWNKPDEEGLIKFLVEEKGFSKERVLGGIKKLEKNLNASTQSRLDSFFKKLPVPDDKKSTKRAAPAAKETPKKKGKKGGR